MIAQSLDFLCIDYNVIIFIFRGRGELVSEDRYRERYPNARIVVQEMPGLLAIIVNLARLGFRYPLQCAVYYSQLISRRISKLVDDYKVDCTVFDMARTAIYGKNVRGPKVIDLDDLLSLRYERQLTSPKVNILGTFTDRVPSSLKFFVNYFSKHVLQWERQRLESFEKNSVIGYEQVITVSSREAKYLANSTGKSNVSFIPQCVSSLPETGAELPNLKMGVKIELVFIGNLLTHQNRESFEYLLEEVLPVLKEANIDFRLQVVGKYDKYAADRMIGWEGKVELLGFVPDVSDLAGKYHAHLAPILSGTGIKSKILDSMSLGIPTVTSDLGIEGLSVTDGKQVLIANKAQEYLICLKVIEKTAAREKVVRSAWEYLRDNHCAVKLKAKYVGVIEKAMNASKYGVNA